MIDQPIMLYHGGKFRMAPWIIQHFPPHSMYVELYGGAGSILALKPRVFSEVYNDLDGEVVNVFRVLQDPEQRERLFEACVLTPYAADEFKLANRPSDDPVESARRMIFRAHGGFGSSSVTRQSGFRRDSKRNTGTPAHHWAKFPPMVREYGLRFAGVTIENQDALNVIQSHDSENTFFYADPPYMHHTRSMGHTHAYRHEMSEDDHAALLDTLRGIQGNAAISGYDSDLYAEKLHDWHKVTKSVAISGTTGSDSRIECLWLSPGCELGQMSLLEEKV